MSLMLGALLDALTHPGDVELARKAAEEVAGYDARISAMEGRLVLLTWMVGTNIVLTILVLGKLLVK